MRTTLFAMLLVLVLVPGCGMNTEVEGQLTITQGLYGQLTQKCDGAECVGAPRAGTPVAWFSSNPFQKSDAGVLPTPAHETTSSSTGFYEFALDTGARGYVALGQPNTTQGTVWFTATSASIPKGLARIDWRPGPANEGTWTDVK